MKIDGKEWKYKLEYDHIFDFSEILGKIKLDLDNIKTGKKENEVAAERDPVGVVINVFQDSLRNLRTIKEEAKVFVSKIYGVEVDEIQKLHPMDFIELWFNFLDDKKVKSFLSRRLGYGKRKK